MSLPSNDYEKSFWAEKKLCVGIDEAGRGPIAGPLVVAGAVLPLDYDSGEINDSKQLSEKKREKLFKQIITDALYYQIVIVPIEEIDRVNIYRATQDAMAEIAKKAPVDVVLTDAMPLNISKHVIDIIKGDTKSCSIAAGSILAKVTRDHIMYGYDVLYPQYGFAKHKGYPTAGHLKALDEYGLLPIYRQTYGPVIMRKQAHLDI